MHVAFSYVELPFSHGPNPSGGAHGLNQGGRAVIGPVANFAEALTSASGDASDSLASFTVPENIVPIGAVLPPDTHKLPVAGKIVPPEPQKEPVTSEEQPNSGAPSVPIFASGPMDAIENGAVPTAPNKEMLPALAERLLPIHNSAALPPAAFKLKFTLDSATGSAAALQNAATPELVASKPVIGPLISAATQSVNPLNELPPVPEITAELNQGRKHTFEPNQLLDQMKPFVGASAHAASIPLPPQSNTQRHQNQTPGMQEIASHSESAPPEPGLKLEAVSVSNKPSSLISNQTLILSPQSVQIVQPIASSIPEMPIQLRDTQPLERLVETITQMRESGQAARSEVSLRHGEFGMVAMRISSSDGEVQARLASRDPGFVAAAQAALNDRAVSASAETNQASPRQQDSGQNSQSNSRDMSGSAQHEHGRHHTGQQSDGPSTKGEHGAVSLVADDHTQGNSVSETRSADGLFA